MGRPSNFRFLIFDLDGLRPKKATAKTKAAWLKAARDSSSAIGVQLPTNRGGRFSKKAETPSTKSFVFPDLICACLSSSS